MARLTKRQRIDRAKQELQKVYDGLIKFADKSEKITNTGINVGLGYLGYKYLPPTWNPVLRVLTGPIGLKLGTSEGIVSQAAGLGLLGYLGFEVSGLDDQLADILKDVQEKINVQKVIHNEADRILRDYDNYITQPERARLTHLRLASNLPVVGVLAVSREELQAALEEVLQIERNAIGRQQAGEETVPSDPEEKIKYDKFRSCMANLQGHGVDYQTAYDHCSQLHDYYPGSYP